METDVLLAAAPSSQICSVHFFLLRDAFLCGWLGCLCAKPPNYLFYARKASNESLQKYFNLLKSEICLHKLKVKVKVTLEQATEAKRGSRDIAILFL